MGIWHNLYVRLELPDDLHPRVLKRSPALQLLIGRYGLSQASIRSEQHYFPCRLLYMKDHTGYSNVG